MTQHADRTGYIALDSPSGGINGGHNSLPDDVRDDGGGRGSNTGYAYGPPGLAGLWNNSYALYCAVFASIGGLTFGYDQGVIANVLVMKDFTTRWPIGPWEKGIMTAVLELGALVGALCAGVLADKYSRRHSILLASLIFILGSSIQSLSISLPQLITGRAVGGVGVGALSMLSPLYMAEISPPEVRGSLMSIEQLAIVSGVVAGFWIGFGTRNIGSSASWRIPLALQIIPGVILGIGCLLLPPSPRLLVLQGQYENASKSLSTLRNRDSHDPTLKAELLDMRVEAALVQRSLESSTKPSTYSIVRIYRSWAVLFSTRYIRRTMIGVMIMFFQQWSAINALLYYGPTLVESIGFSSPTAAAPPAGDTGDDDKAGNITNLLVSGGIGIVQFIAVFPAILLVDKWGRKPLLRMGSVFMGCSHFVIALLIYLFSSDWQNHRVGAWVAVVCMYIFTFAYGTSFGPVGWVLPSEVFPLEMRSKGVAVATATNWINNFLIGLVTPPLMEHSSSLTFMIFATACFGAYLWSTYILPETAGKSLEEIDTFFEDTSAGNDDERGEDGIRGGRWERRRVEDDVRREMGLLMSSGGEEGESGDD